MRQRYFFDKRDMKKFFIKYGCLLLIAIPILIVINYFFNKWFQVESMVFLDIVFLVLIAVLYEFAFFLVRRAKEKKLNKEKTNEK